MRIATTGDGEVLHPGPAARLERRSARLQAHEVSPTTVASPSLLDALDFDLTVEDSTGSDEGSQSSAPSPSIGVRTRGRHHDGRFTEKTSISTVAVGGHSTR